jgi:hypothetical protein
MLPWDMLFMKPYPTPAGIKTYYFLILLNKENGRLKFFYLVFLLTICFCATG